MVEMSSVDSGQSKNRVCGVNLKRPAGDALDRLPRYLSEQTIGLHQIVNSISNTCAVSRGTSIREGMSQCLEGNMHAPEQRIVLTRSGGGEQPTSMINATKEKQVEAEILHYCLR